MSIKKEIIDYIKRNRVSTTEVADALAKTGVLEGVLPVSEDHHEVGQIKCIFAANESNYSVHEELRDVQEGDIVIVFTHNCEHRAVLGALVTKYALLYRGAKALVVDGLVRDISSIKRSKSKVWSKGTTPIGCHNRPGEAFPELKQADIIKQFEGAIAVCDDGGVVIINNNNINDGMLDKLHRIEMQEDIWFFCLDTLKWDTKKIVCDKDYLSETNLLSKVHLAQMDELNKELDK